MSFFRYYKDQKDADGAPLWWPGGPDGFPFRGSKPPLLKENEYSDLRLSGVFRMQIFYLSKEEDAKKYAEIRDKCSNGLYIAVDRDRQWDDKSNNYRIYLEWIELAYDLPPNQSGAIDAVRDYTKQDSAQAILPYRRLAGLNQSW